MSVAIFFFVAAVMLMIVLVRLMSKKPSRFTQAKCRCV